MTSISNEARPRQARNRETLTHDTVGHDTRPAEPVTTELVERCVEVVGDRSTDEQRPPRHLLGWLLVALAVAASIVLAMLVVADDQTTRVPVPDAKDHPNFGPVVTPAVVGDAKDHPNFGQGPDLSRQYG